MNGSTLRRSAVLLAGLCAAPLGARARSRHAVTAGSAALELHRGDGRARHGVRACESSTIIFVTANRKQPRAPRARRAARDRRPARAARAHGRWSRATSRCPRNGGVTYGAAIAFLCWGIGIGVVFYIVSGGNSTRGGLGPAVHRAGARQLPEGLADRARASRAARPTARASARMSDSDTALVARVIAQR